MSLLESVPPALFIAISFPAPGGRRLEKRFPWKKDLRLRHYLRQEKLIGRRFRCRLLNGAGQKVRMNYVPAPGEVIRLQLAGASMS